MKTKCECKKDLKQLPAITLYRGATCEVIFDFSDFDFSNGGHCEFVMKETYTDKIIKKIDFDEAREYKVVFNDDFTINLAKKEYRYDIMYMVNDERYPQCSPSKIIMEEVVNEYTNY